LSHPGIVQAFDSEEENGRHFLVMEYVEGQSLLEVLKRDGRIAPTYAADFIKARLGVPAAAAERRTRMDRA
jgi:serine/threonine-protein kinase